MDTAGIAAKKSRNPTNVEKHTHDQTMNAIKHAHVVICMIDALNAFRVHDFTVA